MSLQFQANDTALENVSICLATNLSALHYLLTTPGSNEAAFLTEVANGTVYREQELQGDRDIAMHNVSRNKQAIITASLAHLQRRFSSFNEDAMLRSMSIFNFNTWPLGSELLQAYGNEQLHSLLKHFDKLLIRNNCDIDSAVLEWGELKIYVSCLVAAQRDISYLDLWQRIITQNEDRFRNIVLVLMIVLLIPIHTSEVERGFSLMKRVKQDWRARLTSPSLNELMRISLLGSCCDEFEPMGL